MYVISETVRPVDSKMCEVEILTFVEDVANDIVDGMSTSAGA